MKLIRRTLRLILLAMVFWTSASVGAFEFDPSTWFRAIRPDSSTKATEPSPSKAPVPPLPAGATPDFRSIVRQAGPAVVGVTAVGSRKTDPENLPPWLEDDPFFQFFRGLPGFQGRQPWGDDTPYRSQGSGFIISSDGLILTNAHVVRNAKEVVVKLSDRREMTAKVLGADTLTDVAVLRVEAKNLPVVRLGDVERLQVGDPVLAIGSPFGFEQTATQGIVSAKGRSLPGDTAVPFIQTDAAVNPGNSGGPLFDGSGAVVGINAQIYSRSGGYQGLAFAIPINVALKVKDQIVAKGSVSHARLGVSIQDLNQSLAESFGLGRPDGALISKVDAGSAAESAGLKPGDVITEVDAEAIHRSGDLSSRIGLASPGDVVRLKIWRDKHSLEVTAKLGVADVEAKAEAQADQRVPPGGLGLGMRPLTPEERTKARVESGLVIESVAGPAARAGLQSGDLLLAINGLPVNTVDEVQAVLEKTSSKVALLIDREGERLFVPIEPD
jgi:serine protease Do